MLDDGKLELFFHVLCSSNLRLLTKLSPYDLVQYYAMLPIPQFSYNVLNS